MLNITKKIEYGLIAMRHINQYGENSLCSSSEIANKYHLPKEIFVPFLFTKTSFLRYKIVKMKKHKFKNISAAIDAAL